MPNAEAIGQPDDLSRVGTDFHRQPSRLRALVISAPRRLAKLEEVVTRLREVAAVSRDDFLRDYRSQWLAERGLELAAQAVLDIGNHVLAGEFGESATEYEGIVWQG